MSDFKDQFVSYEIAVKLKELGFDEPCLAVWYKSSSYGYTLQVNPLKLDDIYNIEPLSSFRNNISKFDLMDSIIEYNFNKFFDEVDGEGNEFEYVYSAPLWQQVIDWLDSKRKIISVNPTTRNGVVEYFYNISVKLVSPNEGAIITEYGYDLYPTRAKALEQAILKALTIIK